MTKYIDAEKLKTEIKRYKNKADSRLKMKGRTFSEEQKDLAIQNLCGNLLHFIDSLTQEQPEVDLNEEIERFIDAHYHTRFDETLENGNDPLTVFDFQDIARHFYELGLNARKKE